MLEEMTLKRASTGLLGLNVLFLIPLHRAYDAVTNGKDVYFSAAKLRPCIHLEFNSYRATFNGFAYLCNIP